MRDTDQIECEGRSAKHEQNSESEERHARAGFTVGSAVKVSVETLSLTLELDRMWKPLQTNCYAT